MKLPKPKKCKVCGNSFIPFSSLTKACSVPCAIKYVEKEKEKKKRQEELKNRREYKAAKDKLKDWQTWFNEAKKIAQKYARLRDYHDGCISCNKPANWHGQWHGSHFRPAGNYKAVALNTWNIHKACSECNNIKSGNLIDFQDKLILKIGQDKVDWLKSQTKPYRHSIEYLKRYKQVMSKRCRMLEKRINNLK